MVSANTIKRATKPQDPLSHVFVASKRHWHWTVNDISFASDLPYDASTRSAFNPVLYYIIKLYTEQAQGALVPTVEPTARSG